MPAAATSGQDLRALVWQPRFQQVRKTGGEHAHPGVSSRPTGLGRCRPGPSARPAASWAGHVSFPGGSGGPAAGRGMFLFDVDYVVWVVTRL